MRPNILFLIADDHRFQALASNGDPVVHTPHLDGLAARGTSFQRTYIHGGCKAAVCVPSRAAIHTGVNPFRANGAGFTIQPGLALMGESFRAAGYDTFATGKWHNDAPAFARSFAGARTVFFGGMCDHHRVPVQDFDPTGGYDKARERIAEGDSTVMFADSTIAYLKDHDRSRPFFLYAAFTAPHDPRTPPDEFRRMYPVKQIPVPPNFRPQHPFDNGELQIRDEKLAAFPRTISEVRRHMAEYYGMISHLDHQIGRILRALDETGEAQNTIVVYVADHGLSVGQHGLLGKQNLYDHSVRVPLIIAGPGVPSDARPTGLVYSHDLFPTLCGLTGVAVPSTVESRPLQPQWAAGARGRESVFSAYMGLQRMVCRGDWKLIEYTVPGQPLRHQLFDLAADAWEMRDFAAEPEHAARVADMARLLEAQRRQFGAPEPFTRS